MRGDLSDTPAADVCRALAVAGATGVLEIEGPDGRGAVVCRDGHVVAATSPTPRARLGDRLVNAGLLEEDDLDEVLRSQARADAHQRLGALLVERGFVAHDAVRLVVQEQVIDAVFDVLRWRYGGYRFDDGDLAEVPEVPLRIPVDQLLVEVARRQHEWDELERVIPDLEAVPAFRTGVGTAAASLEPDEFTVLASIDGSRSVRELADDLGYGQFEAARIVYGLTLLGVVEIRLPEDEVGRALEDALHELAAADLGRPVEDEEDPFAGAGVLADPPPPPPPLEAEPSPPTPGPDPLALEPEPPAPEPEPTSPEPGPLALEPDPPASEHDPPALEPDPSTPASDAPTSMPPAEPGPELEPVGWAAPPVPAEPPPAVDPASLDSPPGLVDVARLLAELETDVGGPATPEEPADDEPADEPDEPDEPEVVAPPPPEPRPDGGDVSELLRELSRLALDDPGDEAHPPPPTPHRQSAGTETRRPEPPRDEPPKRRRRFGRS